MNTSVTLVCVRVLLCVSSVPASCVHFWLVSCPCFMSLWVKYVPAVFVSLCVNYPVYLVPVFWVWFRLVYSLLPGVSVHVSLALSCPALFVKIKDYYLSLSPRLRVPVSSLVCAPWQYETAELFSTLIIIRNAANQHIRMISEGSCDTEDWSNDAENSALITEIIYILKHFQIENSYLKLQ